uniref:50S ribosomal protein L19, chloroplastic n=1 Tax=Eustigmatophyceae sp. Chic 10/23 P-6w TaxID=1446905 RepID=A0A451FMH5_9STRA|nr:ribosomal protein L19 [Eustigmatophyceae sp. Chic 10/23 P-6w]YP_009550676.1 ribosomal protein L19 [Eustigmatophyceae sp. Chic 10/23 P-6w]QAA11547.1 ribosomal protein L19 [Eustigmatophyceae sp. Chic 10/23 P-6w]QAA11606.1 ribosomal protein L19 [Eustigmatophyceae sp. Chic 10/23 P-6w]
MKLNKNHLLSLFDQPARANLPQLWVGDTVRIGILLIEGNKERTQYFEGTIIAYKTRGGQPIALVRKMSQGVGVEKTFLLASPKVVSVERKKLSKVRRAKLYFLRGLTGSKPRKLKDQSWKLKDAS